MGRIHEEKAVEYYNHNFNCSQGVFTIYAIEHGIDEKLALQIATNFGGGANAWKLSEVQSVYLMSYWKRTPKDEYGLRGMKKDGKWNEYGNYAC